MTSLFGKKPLVPGRYRRDNAGGTKYMWLVIPNNLLRDMRIELLTNCFTIFSINWFTILLLIAIMECAKVRSNNFIVGIS